LRSRFVSSLLAGHSEYLCYTGELHLYRLTAGFQSW
jgi:hypothetical protein